MFFTYYSDAAFILHDFPEGVFAANLVRETKRQGLKQRRQNGLYSVTIRFNADKTSEFCYLAGMKTCTVSGCSAAVKAHGLCPRHFMRLRRHGNPEIVMRPGPKPKKRQQREPTARQVAAASEDLNASQIRILRALRDFKRDITTGNELTRAGLTAAVGIGKKYSRKWLDSLWALARMRPPLIDIRDYEGDRKHFHSITAAGRAALKKAEAACKNGE